MEVAKYKLKDIVKLLNGRAYLMPELQDSGKYRILRVGNLSGGNDSWYYSDMELDEDKYCSKGDLLYAWACNFGPHIWNEEKVIYHYHVWKLVEDKQRVDRKYLYYYLLHQTPFYLGGVNGATMVHITKQNMENKTVFIPKSLLTQRRIASILSAYDNLIENNNKRIRMLEQMAENIYKEWFVRFRFPGHEKAEFENGLPKGWREEVASNVIDVMSGGTPKTEREDYYGGDIPFYTPKDADESIFVYSTITNITEEGLAHCNSQYYPVNTLMITARGTVGKLCLLAVPMAMNQSCFALKFKDSKNPYYLYYSIKNEVAKLKKMANGGVFDTIIVKTFDHIKIIVPLDIILVAFDEQVTPILGQIQKLQRQNSLLSRQRDLLLPRLMSGKLEVKE